VIPQWDNRGEGGGVWTFNMQAKGAATTLQQGNGIKRFRLGTAPRSPSSNPSSRRAAAVARLSQFRPAAFGAAVQ
jgi:hypothetical protein